jgi:hypothetical protein
MAETSEVVSAESLVRIKDDAYMAKLAAELLNPPPSAEELAKAKAVVRYTGPA